MNKSAVISECGLYRYELRRTWNADKTWVLFICLNPSKADEEQEDNTSRVCINYAKRWGYGGLVIANLFAYRSTDPGNLYKVLDPVGPENDDYLKRLSSEASETICAWSDDGSFASSNGMTSDPFSYEDFEATRGQLVREIHQSLTEDACQLLVSFKEGTPDCLYIL